MRPVPVSVDFALSSHGGVLPNPDNNKGDADDDVRLARALVDNGAEDLNQLLELQSKGWHDESIERHFQEQRHISDNAPRDLNMKWFEQMKAVLREIDSGVRLIPSRKPLEFLDLGCCPGGFSSYILDKNAKATGFGISLPVTDGGHEFVLENHHRDRFRLSFTNLTYYQLGPSTINDERLESLPPQISRHFFDLALLDGHQLRTQAAALPWDRDRLLISQLIMALQGVKKGGTVILKLPLPHKPLAAKMLYLFSIVSAQLLCWKPKSMHSNRGTFYMVAKGIGRGREGARIPGIVLALRKLWFELTFGGGGGTGRYMTPDDLDFVISTDDIVNNHLDWLTQMGTPLWSVQKQALQVLYRRKGII